MTVTDPGSVGQPPERQRTAPAVGPSTRSRLFYVDSLRGVLMLLGIVLHSAGVFSERNAQQAGAGWIGWDYVWPSSTSGGCPPSS